MGSVEKEDNELMNQNDLTVFWESTVVSVKSSLFEKKASEVSYSAL